ncbi:MAG: 16S rRNA (uracil(1498)-N(3))-methyltransferase [Actinomycetales bacterium]|nr:MAG: 16S rRNA (uracil(1498)-N(3))-methyltransferase [Actinomycetales bacterium]
MTAPMFLVPGSALVGGGVGRQVRLTGPEGRHAAQSMRLRPGEVIQVSDGRGTRAVAVVTEVDRDCLIARVEQVGVEPEPDPQFVLVQALAKGSRDEQAVETATELGVDVIVPWQAERSVTVWRGERAEKSRRRWLAVVSAATKQSRRSRVPEVREVVDTLGVADVLRAGCLSLVLHETATSPLAGVPLPTTGVVVLVVGPEGGISDAELDCFAAAGARPVRLGTEVLRTSSAGPAALAVLCSRSRWGQPDGPGSGR